MAGAIIPNDWDGSSFGCYRVNWPQSEKYEAILLGSVTEPAFLNFWDPETGDEQQAAGAIEDAYNLTIPDFWTKECDEPVLVPTFKVKQTSAQAFSAAAWQVVNWDAYEYQPNDPQFQLAQNVHALSDDTWFGLWHYDLLLAMSSATFLSIRAIDFNTNDQIAETHDEEQMIQLSWDWLWEDTTTKIGIHVYPFLAASTYPQIFLTQFSGHYVGPTA